MRGRRSLSLLALLALLALSGCVAVRAEPALPMPERPPIRFFRVPPDVCLSEADANALATYILQLNEFEAARERLLK